MKARLESNWTRRGGRLYVIVWVVAGIFVRVRIAVLLEQLHAEIFCGSGAFSPVVCASLSVLFNVYTNHPVSTLGLASASFCKHGYSRVGGLVIRIAIRTHLYDKSTPNTNTKSLGLSQTTRHRTETTNTVPRGFYDIDWLKEISEIKISFSREAVPKGPPCRVVSDLCVSIAFVKRNLHDHESGQPLFWSTWWVWSPSKQTQRYAKPLLLLKKKNKNTTQFSRVYAVLLWFRM